MTYKGQKIEVVKIAEGLFVGGYQIKAGEKVSWAFETEKRAEAAVPEVIKFWEKWEGKKSPVIGKYICHECGADFNDNECPVCGEIDMISLRN